MGVQLGLRAACQNFGVATYQLVNAAMRAPFQGGWKRMVTLGPPVFLIACGTGALVYHLMLTLIKGTFSTLYSGAVKLREDFLPRSITVVRPSSQPREPSRGNSQPRTQVQLQEEIHEVEEIVLEPLPVDAAKERNESLLIFLDLIDDQIITPQILENTELLNKAAEKDPFFKQMIEKKEDLKHWLRSIALWQLGLVWDKLEKEYVKRNTLEPPTVESLTQSIELMKLEEELRKSLVQAMHAEEEDVEQKIQAFQKIVNQAELTQEKKLELFGISLQLRAILKKEPMEEKEKIEQVNGMRRRFAVTMNAGMATSLKHMTGILKGWLTVIEKNSPPKKQKIVAPKEVFIVEKGEQEDPFKIKPLVSKISETVTDTLSKGYLHPLWNKKTQEMDVVVEVGLQEEKVEKKSACETLVSAFIKGEKTEKKFFQNDESHKFSTSLISTIALRRMIACMERKSKGVENSILSIPKSLAEHLQPMIVSTLQKAAVMLSQISFKRTIPIVVDYFMELLDCCEAMQKVREKKIEVERESIKASLQTGEVEEKTAETINSLYQKIPYQERGSEIIKELGEGAHKTVRLGLSQPLIQERTWINITKARVKGLLQKHTAQYVEKEESMHWLSALLKTGEGIPTNLVSALLSQQQKVWKQFPGMESMMEIVFLGLQTFAEEKGVDAIQKNLDNLTSTGYLSSTVGIGLVVKLIDASKEKWNENLATLQQIFAFLTPKEQEKVLKHFRFQSLPQKTRLEREDQLKKAPTGKVSENIQKMTEEEAELAEGLNQIETALQKLGKEQEKAIQELQQAHAVMKRALELKQFERIKGLLIYAADSGLAKIWGSLREIVLAVIHQSFSLITYQEVVKHWIFTITDLLLDELEEASGLKKPVEEKEEKQSLIYFIEEEQKKQLLDKIVLLMTSSTKKDNGFFSMQAWVKWGVSKATTWAPGTVWSYIEEGLK
ncbi:MAG: hypothetical protein KDK60_02655, partial [Chlamydiia bacterium]|nr:hypothetical protein [Chlamydiia bacterium]